MDNKNAMRITNEKGIALVLSLFLMTAMSVIAASLMLLSQTETYSSMNYRLMSQARYGAESGLQKSVNYLLYSYTKPTTGGVDPIANYNTNVSPVTCATGCPINGQPVVLSGNTTQASNYPVAGVQANFLAAVQGTLPAGNTTVSYAAYATLMSMQQIDVYGGGVQTIQTWLITSDGAITAGRTAQVQVSVTLETPKFPAQMYAAFGTAGTCGAMTFTGNKATTTDSYDSTNALVGGFPVISNSGGNVGTNGNLTEGGMSTIHGTLSSPRVGVGSCSSGNVDALSSSGGATVTGGIVQLPQAVSLPAPAAPSPLPPTTAYSGDDALLLNGANVGNVSVSNNKTLTLGAVGVISYITVNSLTLSGNANLVILGTVILNVAGQSQTTPLSITGNVSSGNVLGAKFDAAAFQIQYAGTGTIKVSGGSNVAAMIYAPNAEAQLSGGIDFYGSLVAATVADTGGASIHYDRHLAQEFFTVGSSMMSSFSWKKY
jgi:Tfp pilus assembly protein PilX